MVKAWVNTVNASGGVDGHPIQLLYYNDNTTPGTSVTDAQALINAHVDAIIDNTFIDVAWASTVEAANIPVVGAQFNTEPYITDQNFFPSGQTFDSINYSSAATVKAAGAATMAQLYCVESPQCSSDVPVIRAAAQKLGIKDVYDASISATAPDYTAQCVAAQQAHAAAVSVLDVSSVIVKLGQDCSRQGYDPAYVIQGTGYGPQDDNPAVDGNMWGSFPILPYWVNQPEVQQMNAAVDKYYPGLRQSTAWTEAAAQAWTAGLLLEDAVKASGLTSGGTLSAAQLLKGFNSIKNDTLDGWSPPLTFTAGQLHKVDCWYTGRLENGKGVLENNGKLSCENG